MEAPILEVRIRPALRAAALAAAALAGCAAQPESTPPAASERTMQQFSDDAALTARVKSAIATVVGSGVAASIDVDTYRGVVNLSGFVDSQEEASRALAAAKQVDGVRSVSNDLRVKQ